jgi:hypothetical protein
MSGTANALLRAGYQPQPNPLLRALTPPPAPSWGNAADQAWAAIQAKLEAEQKKSSDMGLWTGGQAWEGGHPTVKGVADAAQQYAGTFEGGIKAFHGSPHSFGRFDTSKIGTGEGAQAYGHGLYFAENEGVARSYRDQLSGGTLTYDGKPLGSPGGVSLDRSIKMRIDQGMTPQEALKDALATMRHMGKGDFVDQAERAWSNPDLMRYERNPGHMYEVDINADPERMLHWDKPLSEQSQHVRDALQTHKDFGGRQNWDDRATGAEVYNQIAGDRQDAASMLRFLGIPGIRYLDQGSRTAGEGTHNVVVFDADTINLLRKYGIAGLGVGLGATATQGGE